MQRFVILAIAGLSLSVSAGAFAQNNNGTNYYGAPIYNTGAGTTYYTSQSNGAAPIYNNGSNVQPLPMQQMIAGKNAPSYNFNSGSSAYTAFGSSNPMANVTSIGSLTPEQDAYIRAQNQTQAQGGYGAQQPFGYQQNQYQQPAQNGASSYQGNAFSGLYNNPFGTTPVADIPTKKKVVYKERNNPLVDPPRLFNPDQ